MNKASNQPTGMKGFVIVWFGQFVSMLGTGMTNFAVAFWLFEQTGSATALTTALFFFFAPSVLLSPVAGAIVDRSDRKRVMILSDLIAGAATIMLLVLLAADGIQIWHIYLANLIAGAANSFQFPAYSAAVSVMLPKEQYARASGMLALAQSASNILAPVFAGALIGVIGLAGIMSIDVVTFLVAVTALFVIYIPSPEISAEGLSSRGNLWQESLFGFRYIFGRPGLLGLQLVFTLVNFTATFGLGVMVPMILARTDGNEISLATVQSVSAVGGVVGGLLLSAWGGPKRKVNGVLLGMIGAGLLGEALMGVGQTVVIWAVGGFLSQFFIPILNGANQAIWQAKVVPDVQGRVFAVRRLIAQITAPVAIGISGPLADRFFEPALQSETIWSQLFGSLVGTGVGSGMSLMLVLAGVLTAVAGLAGYLVTAVRDVEELMPDYEVLIKTNELQQRVETLVQERQVWQAAPETPESHEAVRNIVRELREIGREYPQVAWRKS